MAWISLGELTLNYEWQQFQFASFNAETFRVTQPNVGAVDGYFLIRPIYYTPEVTTGPTRRFYPDDLPKIVIWRIPPAIQANQFGTRDFQARLSNRARIFTGQNWRVRLEVW